MSKMWRLCGRGIHKMLCLVGIHSQEQLFLWTGLDSSGDAAYDIDGEFEPAGRMCRVCCNLWEKDDG